MVSTNVGGSYKGYRRGSCDSFLVHSLATTTGSRSFQGRFGRFGSESADLKHGTYKTDVRSTRSMWSYVEQTQRTELLIGASGV
ncbi:hypothetical protein CLOP_g20734 [Closterium sp. NIES-67]|nr:hypothetical protein CLOP_g20734 [Closterium sp. NIES-67]